MKKIFGVLVLLLLLGGTGITYAGKSIEDIEYTIVSKNIEDIEYVITQTTAADATAKPATTAAKPLPDTSIDGNTSSAGSVAGTATSTDAAAATATKPTAGASATAVPTPATKPAAGTPPSAASTSTGTGAVSATAAKPAASAAAVTTKPAPVALSARPVAITATTSISAKDAAASDYVVSRECIRLCNAEQVNVTTASSPTSILSEKCEEVCKNKSITVRKKADDIVKEKPTVKNVCTTSPSQLRELNGLLMRLKNAETGQSTESAEELKQKIAVLRKIAIEDMQQCKKLNATGAGGEVIRVDACSELKAWAEKHRYYSQMENYSEAQLKAKGVGGDEYKKILLELEAGIARLRLECEQDVIGSTSVQAVPDIVALRKPVTADNASEIKNYYGLKVAKLLDNESDTNSTTGLMEAKAEVAGMSAKLLQGRNISIEELDGIAEDVTVSAGSVSVNGAKAQSQNRVAARLKGQNVTVAATASGAMLNDGAYNATAQNLTVNSTAVRHGKMVVGVTPSKAAGAAQVMPVRMRLVGQNGKLVYSVDGKERRKFLWFFDVEMESESVVSAEDGKLLEKKEPWWAGLAAKTG